MSGLSRERHEFAMRREKTKYEKEIKKLLGFLKLQNKIIEGLRREVETLKRRSYEI